MARDVTLIKNLWINRVVRWTL